MGRSIIHLLQSKEILRLDFDINLELEFDEMLNVQMSVIHLAQRQFDVNVLL